MTTVASLLCRALHGRLVLTLSVAATATLAGCASGGSRTPRVDPDEREWVQLFNGRDLTGWTPKIRTHELGENYANTFRVIDGNLSVRYDGYTDFNDQFGHLYYQEPFSYYLLGVEYRFVGEQAPGGPGWARRNSGIMVHSQPPETMLRDQDFPISIEVQLLGGLGEGPRTTANLCTPGTNVVMNGELETRHCINSSSETYEGEQWVRVEVLVLGDSIIKHIVEGDTVLTYTKPQIGGGSVNPFDPEVKQDGRLLTGGYITLQSESHPIDFRKVEILNLSGCTDPQAANYKSYYVHSDLSQCSY
ncbi:MAG TPA: family 16 glycoside hydrolase [Longimicrobiaceae bacterium]